MFKKGDVVRRRNGEKFRGGLLTAVVDRVVGECVWFEHGTWLSPEEIEYASAPRYILESDHIRVVESLEKQLKDALDSLSKIQSVLRGEM